jgi:hypothetical protein
MTMYSTRSRATGWPRSTSDRTSADAEEANLNFGGSLGYLWRGIIGGEFLAEMSPEFELEAGRTDLLFENEPWVNSYMANVIAAVPLGAGAMFQPYVSGRLRGANAALGRAPQRGR